MLMVYNLCDLAYVYAYLMYPYLMVDCANSFAMLLFSLVLSLGLWFRFWCPRLCQRNFLTSSGCQSHSLLLSLAFRFILWSCLVVGGINLCFFCHQLSRHSFQHGRLHENSSLDGCNKQLLDKKPPSHNSSHSPAVEQNECHLQGPSLQKCQTQRQDQVVEYRSGGPSSSIGRFRRRDP